MPGGEIRWTEPGLGPIQYLWSFAKEGLTGLGDPPLFVAEINTARRISATRASASSTLGSVWRRDIPDEQQNPRKPRATGEERPEPAISPFFDFD
jgi:hypothetical protein